MDERDTLTISDEEFEKLFRGGLNSSFEDEGICVTEELIAKTLKAIAADSVQTAEAESAEKADSAQAAAKASAEEAKYAQKSKMKAAEHDDNSIADISEARRAKRSRFVKIAAGIAAALFVGVIGIKVLGGGMQMKSSQVADNATLMTSAASARRDDSAPADTSASDIKESYEEDAAYYDSGILDEMTADAIGDYELAATEEEFSADKSANECGNNENANGAALPESVLQQDITAAKENGSAEPVTWYADNTEISYYAEGNCYSFSGAEAAELYQSIYDIAKNSCRDVVYENVGFMEMELIPNDMGDCLMTVMYIGECDLFAGIINIHDGYCEIHDDKPFSSNSEDYSVVIYRIDSGEALAESLKAMLEP